MAGEDTEPSCYYVPQISQPFLWTEDAHGLYLSFLEDAFVNDLYNRHYCSLGICGYSPPFSNHTSPSSIAADSPAAAPQPSTVPQASQPKSNAESKACRKHSCTGSKAFSTKRKGKWLSQDVGLDKQLVLQPSIVRDENTASPEQSGSSSQSFENLECVVPKGSRKGLKRLCAEGVDMKSCGKERQGTDQVVPLVCEEV